MCDIYCTELYTLIVTLLIVQFPYSFPLPLYSHLVLRFINLLSHFHPVCNLKLTCPIFDIHLLQILHNPIIYEAKLRSTSVFKSTTCKNPSKLHVPLK